MTAAVEIKAADVQKLRQATGAGLMDCKKALADAGGDFAKAEKLLRERGISKSSKRLDRNAGEGIVEAWLSSDLKEGILLEMNCETDFVARNDEFISLAKSIVSQIKSNAAWKSASEIPTEPILALSGKIGEKMEARRFARYKTESGLIDSYIHTGAKVGTIVQIDSKKGGAPSPVLKELAHEIALQIVAVSPAYLNKSEVPADVVEREKEITKKQMEGQNKPPELLEKIATGKLAQYFAANCLLDQLYVKDAAGKTTIQQLVEEAAKKDGTEFTVVRFARFRVGAD